MKKLVFSFLLAFVIIFCIACERKTNDNIAIMDDSYSDVSTDKTKSNQESNNATKKEKIQESNNNSTVKNTEISKLESDKENIELKMNNSYVD